MNILTLIVLYEKAVKLSNVKKSKQRRICKFFVNHTIESFKVK